MTNPPQRPSAPGARRISRAVGLAPLVAFALVVAVGAAAVLVLGVDAAARLAGAVALIAVAAAAAAATALTLTLRRRLAELRHLPDLGRRFVTRHEHGRLTGVTHDEHGVVLHLASADVHTVVLDELGTPDHMTTGMGTSQWRIPRAALDAERLEGLEALVAHSVPVRVVVSGVVGLAGPVPSSWRLVARNGLVVSAGG